MNKKLVIKQEEISDCGVCSLLSIIRYYHGNASLEDLRISSLTSSEGVSALNLINCAIEHGFDAQGKRLESIPIDDLPCIAHVRINDGLSHFLVIYEVKDNKVCMMDPEQGYREMPLDDFNDISTEIFITLKPKGTIRYYPNPISFNTKIKTNILKGYKNLSFIILFNLIYIVTSIVFSFYISFISSNFTIKSILFFLALTLITNVMTYLISDGISKLNNNMSSNLINDFLTHIFNLPLNYIHLKDTNEIIKRVLDLDSIKNTNIAFIITLITNSIIILIVSIVLFNFNKLLLLFISLVILGYLLLTYLLSKRIDGKMNNVIKNETDYNNSLIDYLSGLISIKHSLNENYFKKNLVRKYNDNNTYKYMFNKSLLRVDFLKQCFISSTEFIIDVYLIRLILHGQLDYTNMIVITMLFQLIFNSIVLIGSYIPSLLYQKKIITRINEFYNVQEESNKFKKLNNDIIRINNLSFSYNNCKRIIKGLSVDIHKNDKLIIKGESGCGKSTLCKILNKEYINYDGSIYLGNINYKDIDVKSIRNLLSYVSQDEVLFHGTIKENILMGHQISNKRLDEIINICEIDRIISKKPYGLDTYLYAGGGELSGGERQLIILARSLVLNKEILLLDEALSEVNDEVEDNIINKLFDKYKNKTIIYVSHKNKKDYFHRTLNV